MPPPSLVQGSHARQALSRPQFLRPVILLHNRLAVGGFKPGLFRGSEDVHVRRKLVRIVEAAHAHKTQGRAATRIMAPERHLAGRTAVNLLALSAVRGRVDALRGAGRHAKMLGFDHRVERERGTRFALAPATVAGVNDQGLRFQPESHATTGTAAFCTEFRIQIQAPACSRMALMVAA